MRESVIGTWPNRAHGAACPQLAKADVRVLMRGSTTADLANPPGIVRYPVSVRDVLTRPTHPYTLGMLSSTVHGEMRDRDIEAIPGSPPDVRRLPPGCSFAPRCRYAVAGCAAAVPAPVAVAAGQYACCIKAGQISRPDPAAAGTAALDTAHMAIA
jgi:oligopeptide/dipeptide ABC transporter ATP-binding protein